jgi:beta-glucosidase
MVLAGLLLFFVSSGQAGYSYSGTVKNGSGQGVDGATVTLSGTSVSTRTSGGGAFVLSGSTLEYPSLTRASITKKLFEMGKNRISIYSVNGMPTRLLIVDLVGRVRVILNASPGKSSMIPIDFSGCYVAQVTCGEYKSTFRIMTLRNGLAHNRELFVRTGTISSALSKIEAGVGSSASYLTAAKAAFFTGAAWISQDTVNNIIITLIDSASFQAGPAYLNPSLSYSARVKDLLQRMKLLEKVSLMNNNCPAVSRLSIPAYAWWNEGLHGVGRSGLATSFPTSSGVAATFDTAAIYTMASIISTEARAKNNDYVAKGQGGTQYGGLTFWCPIVDIVHDPRWGRVLETYGEDPYLVSRSADAYIRGMQGNDPRYMKVSATAKHFAAHSGPEVNRSNFNAVVTNHDLNDTYFPSFKSAIQDSKVEAVMCAYLSVNGIHACSNKWLLDTILRRTWGFTGHVVSDCGAQSLVEAGCDLGCGTFGVSTLMSQINGGQLDSALIDTALSRTLMTRFKLGMFDPSQMVPFRSMPVSLVNCQKHIDFARTMSQKSIVLLRNQNNALPIASSVKSIAVVGPNASPVATNDTLSAVMLGNYYGYPTKIVVPLEGITARAAQNGATVNYVKGCARTGTDYSGFAGAETAARNADVVVAVMGLASETQNPSWHVLLEGETIDRDDLRLPTVQDSLLKRLVATGKPVIVVLLNGGALALDFAAANVNAIVEAWYPGEQGGNAIADVLFGDYNPAGRLPITFYKYATTFPAITDMSMANRTYRYFTGDVLYPFGYGLSYSTFTYNNLAVTPGSGATNQPVSVTVDVTNTSGRDGDEVAQVYVTDQAASAAVPIRSLAAFKRVPVGAGQTVTVEFSLAPKCFSFINASNKRVVEPGSFSICVGGGQPIAAYGGATPQTKTGTVTLTGSVFEIP